MALIAVSAMAVESTNIVGYYEVPSDGTYRAFTASLQKIGGGTTGIADIIEATELASAAYGIEMQVYDPDDGVWNSWVWDGSSWTDWTDTADLDFTTGNGYLSSVTAEIKIAGEVVGTATSTGRTYTHSIPNTGFFVFGSAFPVPLKTSNFNFSQAFMAYDVEIQVYDPDAGEWVSWIWDGTGFTDWSDYLPDQIAPVGEGVLFSSSNADTVELVETI